MAAFRRWWYAHNDDQKRRLTISAVVGGAVLVLAIVGAVVIAHRSADQKAKHIADVVAGACSTGADMEAKHYIAAQHVDDYVDVLIKAEQSCPAVFGLTGSATPNTYVPAAAKQACADQFSHQPGSGDVGVLDQFHYDECIQNAGVTGSGAPGTYTPGDSEKCAREYGTDAAKVADCMDGAIP